MNNKAGALSKYFSFNATQLKYALIVLMLVNHITYIFGFTNVFPNIIGTITTIVVPCFLLLFIDGLELTHNRFKYFLRIWLIAMPMELIRCLANYNFIALRGDGFFPQNGVLANFIMLFFICTGIDLIVDKKYLKGFGLILIPVVWSILLTTIAINVPSTEVPLHFLHALILPNYAWVLDCGGFIMVPTGIVFYLLRKHRTPQLIIGSVCFIIFNIFGNVAWSYVPGDIRRVPMTLLTALQNYEYYIAALGILAFFFYNGNKGNGRGRMFYYFYPQHIYLLYILSSFIYYGMHNDTNSLLSAITILFISLFSLFAYLIPNLYKKNNQLNI